MIRFKSFEVLQLAPRCLTMQWSVENIPDGFTEFITVHRSESPEGPWEPIGKDITSRDHFHDHDANIYHPNLTVYYKLTGNVVEDDPGPGGSAEVRPIKPSKVEFLRYKPDAIAMSIIRRQNLLLSKRNGTPGYFLIRRTWGTKCTACFSKELNAVQTSDCGICYNTKYVGGYYEPIEGFCAADNTGKTEQPLEGIKFSTSMLKLWTTNSPDLKKGDVWVDSLGKRWIIESIDLQTTRLRSKMRQLFTAFEIPAADRVYEIAVPNVFELDRNRSNHIWRVRERVSS